MTDIPESLRPFHAPHGPDTSTQVAHFAPGVTPDYEHKHGVLWRGPWQEAIDSTGIATRLHLRALASVGVPVRAVPSSGYVGAARETAMDEAIGKEILAEVGHLREPSIAHHEIEVDHLVPTLERVHACLYPGQSFRFLRADQEARARRRVLLSVWERDRISPQMADILRKFGQNWVPCARNAHMLREAGVDNVHVVPHPFDPESPLPAIGRAKVDPTGGVVFYAIAKWEPRKSLHELLGAFLSEFRSDEQAVLGLKTSPDVKGLWKAYPEGPVASLRHWLAQADVRANGWTAETIPSVVRIVTEKLPTEWIWRMHHAGHVYVSASHGEGFDFPAFDAMVARSRLVHVGFGGSEDYAPADAIPASRLPHGLEPSPADYRWYGGHWAKVDPRFLRAALRQAYEERKVAARPVDLAPWSFARVGGQMKTLLVQLAKQNGTEVSW